MAGVNPEHFPKVVPFTKGWHTAPYDFISTTRPELSAAGRNVVVTGGATGIGNAVAIAFAQAGAKSVSIIGRRADVLKSGAAAIAAAIPKDSPTQILYETADLTSRADTTRAFQALAAKLDGGAIDVLVSNAGSVPDFTQLAGVSDEQFLSHFQGLVLTAMHAMQAWLPLAPTRGDGTEPVLLSTNTCFAHWPAVPNGALYASNRAALLKLTDYVQAENPHVRVVSVQPGWVATAGNGYQKEAPDSPALPGQFYLWLASPEAAFLKGKFVWANWDAQELVERADEIKNSKLLTTVLEGADL